ncbi:MAG: hypothetical protein EOP82_04840 [Variovorax sp.]|nr:MAG: hypothetical protein EOP82_04840 [Variovorax sp.]
MEVSALAYRLREYPTLFATSRERFDFLNTVAPVFFRMLFESLWGDMLMHLTRVTGPSTTGWGENQFHNLTLQRLPGLVDAAFRNEVTAAVTAAVAAAAFAEPGRNKVYAHTDLGVVKDLEGSEIVLGSINEMDEAIARAELALDAVARNYGINRGTYYDNTGWGVAEDLVQTPEAGVKAQPSGIAARMVAIHRGGSND